MWRDIASFFTTEPESACVRLLTATGAVQGYWDDDSGAWYREHQGPDLESEPIEPTHWRPGEGLPAN